MSNLFLKLGRIGREVRGGSVDALHIGWIDILTFSLGGVWVSSSPSFSSNFSITKRFDSASAGLYNACTDGDHFKTAVVEFIRSNGRAMTWAFRDVMVESFTVGAAPSDNTESIHLVFKKVGLSPGVTGVAGAALAAVSGAALTGVAAALAAAASRTLTKK